MPPKIASKPNIIVIGSGLLGSWTAYFLSAFGAKVTLIDRKNSDFVTSNFATGSIGFSRIIRQTAYESDLFPKMVVRSNQALLKISNLNSEEKILKPTNCLIFGDSPYIDKAIAAAKASQVDHEVYDQNSLKSLYPFLNSQGLRGVHEMPLQNDGRGAAILNPAVAITKLRQLIQENGANLIDAEVSEIKEDENGVTIKTAQNSEIIADKVVVAANVWTAKLLPKNAIIENALTPKIAKLFYFEIKSQSRNKFENFPTIICKIEGGARLAKSHPQFVSQYPHLLDEKSFEGFYAMIERQADKLFLKVGHAQPDAKFKADPDLMLTNATIGEAEENFIAAFLKEFFPGIVADIEILKSHRADFTQAAPLLQIADNLPIISPLAQNSKIIVGLICCSGIGAKIAAECARIVAHHALNLEKEIDPKLTNAFSIDRDSLLPNSQIKPVKFDKLSQTSKDLKIN
ncbi:MAG: FAD-dependent oxidoreductase [Rickettsiales bacterium]|nr:FAD-dependent oxidoreductase [Rickettsiales bacterium]